ncbi:MAG: hypothetical protein ACXADC_05110 [Candidatus Thorarchaeota archaeon]
MDLLRFDVGVPPLERKRYHRLLFKSAAIWNWVLAISFIVLPRIDIGYFSLAGDVPPPPTLLWADSFFLMVFVVGLLLYAISISPESSQSFIPVVIFEKVTIFVLGFFYFIIGEASIFVVAFVAVDLLFGILFVEHLFRLRKDT